MEASVRLIETEGVGAVSLRRVAREADVSSGAPYHHFADRASLLAAIAVRGHQLLAQRLAAVAADAAGPVDSLARFIEAYVVFGREHQGHMRVMFRPELFDPEQHPDALTAGDEAIALLTRTVVACQEAGHAPPGDPTPLVTMVWSVAVGIVTLWIDGPLDVKCTAAGTTVPALTAQISALVESLLLGYRPTPGSS